MIIERDKLHELIQHAYCDGYSDGWIEPSKDKYKAAIIGNETRFDAKKRLQAETIASAVTYANNVISELN